jgi:hypothetical protein
VSLKSIESLFAFASSLFGLTTAQTLRRAQAISRL